MMVLYKLDNIFFQSMFSTVLYSHFLGFHAQSDVLQSKWFLCSTGQVEHVVLPIFRVGQCQLALNESNQTDHPLVFKTREIGGPRRGGEGGGGR